MIFYTCCMSDKGLVRLNNEDTCYCQEADNNRKSDSHDYALYMVADGMGGHQAGEVASGTAIEHIVSAVNKTLISGTLQEDYTQILVNAIIDTNTVLYALSQTKPDLAGMGTTLTAGLRIAERLYLGHVGDSRAYLFRNNETIRLTNDHSLVANLIKAGMISEQEARTHPDRNKIFRSLGTSPDITVDTYRNIAGNDSLPLMPDDILLFCTDGLHGLMDDEEIQTIVAGSTDLHHTCKQLIAEANTRGGTDNISVVMVKSE